MRRRQGEQAAKWLVSRTALSRGERSTSPREPAAVPPSQTDPRNWFADSAPGEQAPLHLDDARGAGIPGPQRRSRAEAFSGDQRRPGAAAPATEAASSERRRPSADPPYPERARQSLDPQAGRRRQTAEQQPLERRRHGGDTPSGEVRRQTNTPSAERRRAPAPEPQRPAFSGNIQDPAALHTQGLIGELKTRIIGRDMIEELAPGRPADARGRAAAPSREHVAPAPAAETRGRSAPHPVEGHSRPAPAAEGRGRVSVFLSCHGGTGSTLLAANVGAILAKAGRNVGLVDLDLQFGDVLTFLGLELRCPLSQITQDIDSFDWEMLSPMLSRHGTGLCLLSQVGHLEGLNDLDSSKIPVLLRALQTQFDHVLIDGVRDFSDHALAAIDVADQIILVVTQDVPAIRGANLRMEVFHRIGFPESKVKLVINRFVRKSPITAAAIRQSTGLEPVALVTNDFAVVHQAIDEGITLEEVAPGALVTRDLQNLAAVLFGHKPSEPPRPRGLWQRLWGSRK